MKKLNIAILHFTASPIVGGVEIVMREHSRLFSSSGYLVTIFAGRGRKNDPQVDFKLEPLFSSNHPTILKIKNELDNGVVSEEFHTVKDTIKQILVNQLEKFDVIFAHNICSLHKNLPLTTALYEFIQRSSAPKLIAWDHDLAWKNHQYLPELYDQWPYDLLKKTWHPGKHIHVTISNMRKKELESILDDNKTCVHSIPSGIEWKNILNLHTKTIEIINTFRLFDAEPLFFMPVRITRRKNIELALEIIAHMRDAFPQAIVLISGPIGPHNPKNKSYFEDLIRLSEKLRVHPRQQLESPGPQAVFLAETFSEFLPMEVIYDLYRFSDALLFPSFQEGFGIPILEAGLVQLPIFCSDIPPFHETAGDHAVFFDPNGQPASIANRIAKEIQNNGLYLHKKRVQQTYVWDRIFKFQIEPLVTAKENCQ